MNRVSTYLHLLISALLLALCIAIVSMIGCASGGGTEGTWGRSYSGVILSEQGVPQESVTVEMLETGATAVTDADGMFNLPTVELGNMPVTLQLSGQSVDTQVIVDATLPEADAAVRLVITVSGSGDAQVTSTEVQANQSDTPPTPQATPRTPQGGTPSAKPSVTPQPGAPTPRKTPTPRAPTATPDVTPPPLQSTPTPQPTATPTPQPTPDECPGDLDDDGEVGLSDLAYILSILGSVQGQPGYDPDADFNDNGVIDQPDVDYLQSVFGSTC
ncbi:MAG: hypothetical protein QY326_06535 [Bdellovibrionota bacterium]|nr:MAG: hypothetical protein QY326_06535 [Bdellovibrionota bacterium]